MEYIEFEYIEFGYGYRLHRRDSANWELQESRKPSNKGFAKNMEDRSPKWCNCGKLFQSLSAALAVVCGLAPRKDEEGAFQMPSDCPYCGKPHFNFGDDEEGVEMWTNEPNDGEYVIVADPPFAWSIPINYCPFCGRDLAEKADE